MNEDIQAPELDQPVLELQAGQQAAAGTQQQFGGVGSVIPITQGGTGSSTAAGALANLGAAPLNATYIVQTASSGLSAEQALGLLATGILKSTTTTGVVSIADITDINALLAVAWASWTPTWTNLSVGDGTVTAAYVQVGKTVFFRVNLVFGSTTAVSGDIRFSLPVTAKSVSGALGLPLFGNMLAWDTSAGAVYFGKVLTFSTTVVSVRFDTVVGVYINQAIASATVPFTWATGDEIGTSYFYESA